MIKRYALTSKTTYAGTPILNEFEHEEGVFCKWSDVEPIIAERDELLKRLSTYPSMTITGPFPDKIYLTGPVCYACGRVHGTGCQVTVVK